MLLHFNKWTKSSFNVSLQNKEMKPEIVDEGLKSIAAAGLLGLATLNSPAALRKPLPPVSTNVVKTALPLASTNVIKSVEVLSAKEEIIAATLIGEAASEGRAGMQAVLNVIMNRAKGDISVADKVCLSPYQFSMWNGKVKSSVISDSKKFKQWAIAIDLIKLARAGKLEDITGNADFYFNPKLASPKWAKQFIKTKTIGNHVFYNHGKAYISKFF